MSAIVDPNTVILPRQRKAIINIKTELELLKSSCDKWSPVVMYGRNLIDGLQRVLVARKHKYPFIPARWLKDG